MVAGVEGRQCARIVEVKIIVAPAVVGRVVLRERASQELLQKRLHTRQAAGTLYVGRRKYVGTNCHKKLFSFYLWMY